MTQEEFGLYGYLIAMVAYLATLLNGGLYLVQSKLYFEYIEPERGQVLYTLNILLFVALSFVLALLVLFDFDKIFFHVLFKHPINYSLFRIPILVGVFVTAFGYMITYYFLASGSIKKLQLFNILRTVVVHASVLGLLYTLPDVDSSFLRISVSYFTELILVIIFIVIIYKSMMRIFNWAIVKRAILLASPIALYSLFSLIIFTCDRFFIERLGSMKDLAIYNLAWVLAGVIPFISNSIHGIWLPELLKEKNSKILWRKARFMGIKLLIGFTLISFCIVILVKILLAFSIISNKYEAVVPILPIILVGSMMLSLFQLVFNYLLSVSKIFILVYISIVVALLGIWITPFLVSAWGVYGAAISMVIMNLGLLTLGILYGIYYYKKHPRNLANV